MPVAEAGGGHAIEVYTETLKPLFCSFVLIFMSTKLKKYLFLLILFTNIFPI